MTEPQAIQTTTPPHDDALVDQLLTYDEEYRLDCKRLAGKLASALETVVAFANSDGGVLLLGLEDPRKAKGRARVYGVEESPMGLDELRRSVETRITPELPGVSWRSLGCTLRDGQSGSIVVVSVPKSLKVHSIVGDGT